MNRRILSSLVAVIVVFAALAGTADAQSRFRADKTVYLKARVGQGFYMGTRDGNVDSSLNDYFSDAKLGFGGELGLQLNSAFGLGLSVNFGNYDKLGDPVGPPSIDAAGISDSRTSVHLQGTLRAFDTKRISPYLLFGAGATFGTVNDAIGSQTAIGP
ncbi:MAG: hypothetical protein R3178_00330, partial [Rhodothermales bacterium]|nr:hypothetical protein [Rhodothermales bacterium]